MNRGWNVSLPIFIFGLTPAFAFDIVAFKGVHQSVRRDVPIANDTCTASISNKEPHSFIENTVPGLREGFRLGATIGHFNIRKTADNRIVAFHDPSLECRTNGNGKLSAHTLEELRTLDVGFGYTFDNGLTFPVRGMGVGLIPTIEEILTSIPDKTFVINDKDNSQESIAALQVALKSLPPQDTSRLLYLGERVEDVKRMIPNLRVLNSSKGVKDCATWWLLLGWSGYVPHSCKNTTLLVPVDQFDKFGGRIEKFAHALHSVNSQFWVLSVDSVSDFERVSKLPVDAIGSYRLTEIMDHIPQ